MLLRMYVRWAEAHGYKVEWLEESGGEEAGHQIGDGQDQRPRRLWLAEDRERRASPGAHLALRFERAPPYQLRLGLGLSGHRRQDRGRDQRQGSAHRHLPLVGRRRPARQQDRQRGAHHPHAERHRRAVPERALAAPEPRACLCDAARPALRGRAAEARGGDRGDERHQDRHRLGPPDPLLRAAALPDGEGPAHRRRNRRTPARCSTATSTASSPPPSPPASKAPTRSPQRRKQQRLLTQRNTSPAGGGRRWPRSIARGRAGLLR